MFSQELFSPQPANNQTKVFRFETFQELLKALNLSINYKVVKITGTNGKTATACCLTELVRLQQPELKIGLFISPHVLDYRERISINFVKIPHDAFQTLYLKHQALFQKYHCPLFHIFFLISLLYFQSEKIDLGIFELGIGAKYDVVNLLHGQVEIITSISLDHQYLLGRTKQAIFDNKKHIVNPNSVCVSNLPPGLFKQLSQHCQTQSAIPINLSEHFFTNLPNYQKLISHSARPMIFQQNKILLTSLQLALIAYQQLTNQEFNKVLPTNFLHFYQFRFSHYQHHQQKYIFDGGHNAEAANHFLNNLDNRPISSTIIVFSAIKHKAAMPILKLLTLHYRVIVFSLPGDASYKFNLQKVSKLTNCQLWSGDIITLLTHLTTLQTIKTIGVFGSFRLVSLIWNQLKTMNKTDQL